MLVIATDEAGYGPQLGPLIIASTVWNVPADEATSARIDQVFAPLRDPFSAAGNTIVVDDSKTVYRPGGSLMPLHLAVGASQRWCGYRAATFHQLLPHIVSDEDLRSVAQSKWLGELPSDIQFHQAEIDPLLEHWQRSDATQVATRVRVITAAKFNQSYQAGSNKAELLSEATLGLVKTAFDSSDAEQALVYCDRHGGRRYYGAVIQHVFPSGCVRVISESSQQSCYQVTFEHGTQSRQLVIHFTVKGDSFTPVALSSLHAKYLRERFMQSLNLFFERHWQESNPLRPTAGYPADAKRFLRQTKLLRSTLQIEDQQLIRIK